jgi:hypothetical protein
MKIVYTCVTGRKDDLKEQPTHPDWKFVCFTDNLNLNSNTWEIRPLVKSFDNARKTARWHKLHPEDLFLEAEVSLWVDASIIMKVSPQEYWERFGGELAVLPSPYRDCLYDEAETCKFYKMDDLNVIDAQVDKYRGEGMPEHFGMIGTGFMFREHTLLMEAFNKAWWREIDTHSIRDQISFPYVAWKLGVVWKVIPLESVIIMRHRR